MAKLTGIDHVAIRCCGVQAFEETVKFYTELLGLRLDRSWGEGEGSGALIAVGESYLEIFANRRADDPASGGAYIHVALSTDDVDGMVEQVRAAGYAIKVEPKYLCVGGKPPRSRLAFCYGPNGEEIEFFTRDCPEE